LRKRFGLEFATRMGSKIQHVGLLEPALFKEKNSPRERIAPISDHACRQCSAIVGSGPRSADTYSAIADHDDRPARLAATGAQSSDAEQLRLPLEPREQSACPDAGTRSQGATE